MNGPFSIGVPEPATAEERKDCETADGCRRAIAKAARNSSLIHKVLYSARVQGASGEDTYAVLAYHALRLAEDMANRNLELLNTRPPSIFIRTTPTDPKTADP